jgi:putative membrane protein
MLVGSINTIVMGLSFISLYSINIKRTGSAAAISQLLSTISLQNLFFVIGAILISGLFSFYIGILLSKILTRKIEKINYKILSIFVLLFISSLVIVFSGFLGLFILLISTFLGLFVILTNSRRTLLMGCLMLPALLLYLPI